MPAEPLPPARWTEDLVWQARRAFAVGNALCTCEGNYHTLWGSLRAAEVANSLKAEEPLLASLIAPLIRGDVRVMIGGAADPGVLCVIGRIHAPRRPLMTVIDRCAAPLEIIREFTTAKGLACRTVNLNLLDLDGREQWEQIVLHYTSEFVETHLHGRFFKCLARSLARQGTLVCAAMTGTRVAGGHDHELGDIYFDYCLKALKDSPLADLAEVPGFAQSLRSYSARWGLQKANLPTSDELRDSIRASGLRILSENHTPRRRRFAGGAAIIDSSSLIVAGH